MENRVALSVLRPPPLRIFDAFQQHSGRFVVRVLRHKLALEGALQDGLAQL